MARNVSRHWLHENAATRSPYRVLVIDTETRPKSAADQELQVLRLWAARLVRRQGVDPGEPRHQDYQGSTAAELGELVHRLARRDRTLWLYAHNLSFDLAVTALPVELVERGWRLTEGALTSDSPWCRMSRGDRRLTISDTWSWLPASVEAIGGLIGRRKLPLPEWEADDDAWLARCRRDVAITAEAIIGIMDWWDQGQLGNWSVSGPAAGWSTYRHRRPVPHVLIDPDPEVRAFEARAINGGRREAWRTGHLERGLYADLDLATAHLTVMSSRPLPARRFQSFDQLSPDSPYLRSRIFDVLAECELDVVEPRYPWDSGHGYFHPIGRFRSILAGPEIRDAIERGELVAIGRGHVYHVRAHMAPWAVWLATLLAVETPDVPATVRLLAKHWSRCVPGKWAGHTSEVIRKVPDPRPGWAVERGAIAGRGRAADFLRLGGELWTIARDEWADDAFPAILAFIQSHTRVAVGRLIDAIGPAAISVNTDGVMLDVLAWWRARTGQFSRRQPSQVELLRELDAWAAALDPELAPFSARIKGAWTEATVYGPQHLVLGGERHLAGIPRRAQVLADGRYRFTAWPKLRVQLMPERPPSYRTEPRTVRLDAIPPTGWLWASGAVTPLAVGQVEGRDQPLAPLASPAVAAILGGLAAPGLQHPILRPLLPGEPPAAQRPRLAPGGPARAGLAPGPSGQAIAARTPALAGQAGPARRGR